MLYAIADGLELDLEGQRVSILLQNLHNHLVAKYNQGERCVVLVDEAHAMPSETLEELRLLYNLQIGKQKLIQIVLFGQPELDVKLEQNNMRQLKDRIVHHFNMQPLSKKVIESYLMFRMRAAGYHGPDIFSPAAVNLIGKASSGLMRRVNILADKSLLAAFVENTHSIEARHVQAAIRDSEMSPNSPLFNRKKIALGVGAILSALLLGIAGWMLGKSETPQRQMENSSPPAIQAPVIAPPSSIIVSPASQSAQASSAPTSPQVAQDMPPLQLSEALQAHTASSTATPATSVATSHSAQSSDKTEGRQTNSEPVSKPTDNPKLAATGSLLQQRLVASKDMLTQTDKGGFTIQLYYTEDANPTRIERFLSRAQSLDKLSEIYLIPIKINGKAGFRVLYGTYPNSEAAHIGMKNLPQRYKDAFAPTLIPLDNF